MITSARNDLRRPSALARMVGDKGGNFAVMTALLMPVGIMAAGVVVDISSAVNVKSDVQSLIDAAALAGVAIYDGTNAAEAKAAATKFLNAGSTRIPASLSFQVTPGTDSATLTVTASGTSEASLMKIAGVTSMPVSASATALRPRKPIAATFTAKSAKGWYYKVITVRVVRPGSTKEEVISTITYQPTTHSNNGTGTMTVSPTGETALGEFTKLVMQMDIKEDSCPIGYKNTSKTNAVTCDAASAKKTSDASYFKYSYTLRTDDPSTSDHLFIDGVQRAQNKALDYTEILNCTGEQEHSWEDQKTVTLSDTRDFFYKVKPKCVFDDGALRLTE